MEAIAIGLVLIAAAVLLLFGIATGWFSRHRKGAMGILTAYHDFSPRPKRNAAEIVMEKKAGKSPPIMETR
jgi:hypothetical protein